MNKHRNADRNFERQERSEQPRVRHDNRHQARENSRHHEDRPSRVKPEQTPFNATEYSEELQAGLKVFEADSFHDIFSGMQHLQQAFWLARRGGPQVVRDFAKSLQAMRGTVNVVDAPVEITGHVEVTKLKDSADDEQFPLGVSSDGHPTTAEYVKIVTGTLPKGPDTEAFIEALTKFDYFYEFSTDSHHKAIHGDWEAKIISATHTHGEAYRAAAQAVYDHVGRELIIE